MRCEDHDVAQKLIASAGDLELIAADDVRGPGPHGWRREIFGADALALKHCRLALTVVGRRVRWCPSPRRAWLPFPSAACGEAIARIGITFPAVARSVGPTSLGWFPFRQCGERGLMRYRGPRAFALAVATERPSARPSASRRRSTASPYMTPPFFGNTTVRRSPARRRLVSLNSRWVAPDRE